MNKRILVMDDDLYIRELYEEVLKNAGYEVITAVDGEEGYKLLTTDKFDLVLLDMMMPKLDGLGVLSKLIETPPVSKDVPIILLSNLGNEPVTKDAIEKGARAYLIKADITPDQLLEFVAKYLKD